jgi:hypothetical protein
MRCSQGVSTNARGCFLDVTDIYMAFEVQVDGLYGPYVRFCPSYVPVMTAGPAHLTARSLPVALAGALQPTASEFARREFQLPRNGPRHATEQLVLLLLPPHEPYSRTAARVRSVRAVRLWLHLKALPPTGR